MYQLWVCLDGKWSGTRYAFRAIDGLLKVLGQYDRLHVVDRDVTYTWNGQYLAIDNNGDVVTGSTFQLRMFTPPSDLYYNVDCPLEIYKFLGAINADT